uniref:ARAD1C25674p n=1 Tax=Blastobotrys adeninivorans TaxID=409370 RepID=A0A060T2J1_BLAAD
MPKKRTKSKEKGEGPPSKKTKSENGAVDESAEVHEAEVLGDPNQTLYVNNLNDKVNKIELRRNLYHLFTTYGHIVDIVALKTAKMRGQAHIAFADVNGATAAAKSLQGYEFLGKPLRISYARGKSRAIAMIEGTVGPANVATNATDDVPQYASDDD